MWQCTAGMRQASQALFVPAAGAGAGPVSTTLLSPLYSSANLLKPPSITTTSLVTPSSCRRARRAAAEAGPRCRLLAQCTTTCSGREVW